MIVGIDPGGSGALVLLHNDGQYVDHLMMPILKIGTKTRVNGAAIAAWLEQWRATFCLPGAGYRGFHAYLEKVSAMPKQGVASTFTFGHAAGLVEGIVTGAGIPITLVSPQAWKKTSGLIGSDKDVARSRAVQLYPELRVLDLKGKGQAVADAILIARHGSSLYGAAT